MICTDTYTATQLAEGIMLTFDPPVRLACGTGDAQTDSGSDANTGGDDATGGDADAGTDANTTAPVFDTEIDPALDYFYYFDYVRSTPDRPVPEIAFTPPSASYTMRGNKSFSPKIFVSIKTTHASQIQVLFRLTIKDRYNKTLYTDYKMITTKSEESITMNATILNSNNIGNLGPSGNSIIEIQDTNLGINRGGLAAGDENSFSSQSLTLIKPGMEVDGPGIPEDIKPVYIKGIIFGTNNQFELSVLIPTIGDEETNPRQGLYTFTRDQACLPPEVIEERELVGNYIILDKTNSWKYIFQDRVIASFYREDQEDEDIVIFLPVKNASLLPNKQEPSDIALAPITKIAGRVIGDTQCIAEIT